MSENESSNTTPEQQPPKAKKPGGATGKGFVKGDPRINRKGRPKSFDKLRDFAQSLLAEAAKDKDGHPLELDGHIATNLEVMLRQAMRNPRLLQYLLEVAYGKVPQQVDVTTGGQPIKAYIGISPDDWKS